MKSVFTHREHEVGIDWERRTMSLVGTHKGAHSRCFREVPLCPRLYDILLTAYGAAPDGPGTATGLSPNNLNRNAQAIRKAAKLAKWPKFFNALRKSCEDDWKEGRDIAEATYCKWIGHGSDVSRKHYVSPKDSEIASVTGICAPATRKT